MLELSLLTPMQEILRNLETLRGMIEFVKGGGFWTVDAVAAYNEQNKLPPGRPIYITRFTDEANPEKQLYIHDGHTRITAVWLGGRTTLREDEYEQHDWTYSQYMTLNKDNGFVTPFDPRVEVRVPDLKGYWQEARNMLAEHPDLLEAFVARKKSAYARQRTMHSVAELAAACDLLLKRPKPKKHAFAPVKRSFVPKTDEQRNAEAQARAVEVINAQRLRKSKETGEPYVPIDSSKIDEYKEMWMDMKVNHDASPVKERLATGAMMEEAGFVPKPPATLEIPVVEQVVELSADTSGESAVESGQ